MNDQYFIDENIRSASTIQSKDSKYTLEITYYNVGNPEDHFWNFTRGKVFDTNGKLLVDAKRNYSHFWYLFVNHPNGNDYFLCGKNYHGGYSIFDLTNDKEYTYNPKSNLYKSYWCWVEAEFFEDNQTLVVNGCYWGDIFENVTFDFSDPSNIPLPELSREDERWDDEDNGD